MKSFIQALAALALLVAAPAFAQTTCNGAGLANPVMFVTQYPVAADFATIGSVFANHRGSLSSAGRGGHLWICYPNNTLRNLTAEAGLGMTGFQGAQSISVRDPDVHWSGTKALFSMVVGAPTAQFQVNQYYWQIYEVTGLGLGQTVAITQIAGQPDEYNNVQPTYAPDGSIVFVTDRPRNGQRHLYPQHDEYESTATPTGLWKMFPGDPSSLMLMQHSPSGSFDPLVDSYGRVLFTRWDHLQRDQQNFIDYDQNCQVVDPNPYGTFNWSSEAEDAEILADRSEVFPEPRDLECMPPSNVNRHTINHFFPWQVQLDGTGEETLNHIGRHELQSYFDRSFNDDPEIDEFIAEISGRLNPNSVLNVLQIRESATQPGRYVAIDAPEFGTHAAGQLISIDAQPELAAAQMQVLYTTTRASFGIYAPGDEPPADFSGRYRDPVVLANGSLMAAHTAQGYYAANLGTRANPDPNYDFRIHRLVAGGGGALVAGAALTAGISVSGLNFWDPDVLVTYNGPMWELYPVEVVARSAPPAVTAAGFGAPERQSFNQEGVNISSMRGFLRQRELGLLVTRNATSRDALDEQQPYNLRVPGGVQTIATGSVGQVYDIAHFQFFQGDQIRGIGGSESPNAGRRVIAQFLHDATAVAWNPPHPGGPQASQPIAADGSVAAFVPTRRALSWQALAPDGEAIVRERYWVTFQPGEIRACDGCHGATPENQAGAPAPDNAPSALEDLLSHWKQQVGQIFADDVE